MRIHLIGAGGMGKTWAQMIQAAGEHVVAGWSDVRPGAVAEAAAALSLDTITGTDYRADLARSGADFVVDVTPPDVHREVTEFCLRHGLPVLGEKPMADSMESARAMVRASEESGRLYMVSQSRRFHGWLHAFRREIESLGALSLLNADFYLGPHFGGFRDEMESVLLLDMAIHTFDAARFLSGSNAVAVYAEEFNPGPSWYRGAACANVLFEMQNGARFSYRGSWCAEGFNTSWEGDWRAVGARGSAIWDGHERCGSEVAYGEGFIRPVTSSRPSKIEMREGISGSLEAFVRALQTGEVPPCECHDNLQSLAMVFGAAKSSREGRRIAMREILEG